jgi:hypothetical protein
MARIDIKGTSTGGGGGGGNLQLAGGASMDATLRAVTDTSNTASPLKLSTASVQVNSPLRITTSDASGFYLDAEDSATNNRFSIKRDPSSQEVTLDFASNPTGSTSLVGAIRTYGDGVNLSNAMSFREDGYVGIGTDTPGAKLDIHSSGATVAQFNKTGSGNSYIQQLTAGSAKWKHGFTSASGAFDIIDDVNSLTRLSLLNTGQLKLNAYTSTSAFTGTTAGFLAFDSSGNILSVASPATSPAGSTGAVQFNNGGAFGADSTQLFWNDTNNRLGVGTATPTAKLQVTGNGSTSATTSLLVQNSAGSTILEAKDDQIINGYNGTQLRFRFGNAQPGISTRSGALCVGYIDAGSQAGLQFNASGSGKTYIDGWNEGGSNQYDIVIASQGSRVQVGTDSASVSSSQWTINSTTRGFLPPRMTNAQRAAITTPAVGLMVYCTDAVEGLYIYKSTGWTFVI